MLGKGSSTNTDLIIQPSKGQCAVIKISDIGEHRLLYHRGKITVPSHSLLWMSDALVLYLITTSGQVIHLDIDGNRHETSQPLTEGFLRGAARIDQNRAVLGSSQDLILYDVRQKTAVERIRITQNPDESVYDVTVLPTGVACLPGNLNSHRN